MIADLLQKCDVISLANRLDVDDEFPEENAWSVPTRRRVA